MMTGGLSYTDTMLKKHRTPIFAEWRSAVRDHYETEYGRDSESYARCEDGYIAEPHVGEQIFEALTEDTENLDIIREFYPSSVVRVGNQIKSVTFQSFVQSETVDVSGDIFIEATYEGDLMAVAGVSHRIGRESRSEHDEQFAGRLYTRTRGDRYYPQEAVGDGVDPSAPPDRRGPLDTPAEKNQGELDLVPHPAGISELHARSTGEGDQTIQAYNYRLCLTDDPEKRIHPSKPDGYDSSAYDETLEEVKRIGFRSTLRLRYLPNDKADMNTADLPGKNYDYPTADWSRRREIAAEHERHALGLLYFLQNDQAVPSDIQTEARNWGLASDEWEDNDNFPFQLYIREARRLDGQYTFSESDARHAPGLDRAPIHEDSISVIEYPLDSHACTDDRQAGSHPEGHFFASQVTRPAQFPYRSILPKQVDNMLVPVPASATHVGYGSIRLEPTWIHIGESTGYAAALAVEQDVPPSDVDVTRLQKRLVDDGVMISFFNDTNVDDDDPWSEPIQYLATKGFFSSYNADPESPLAQSTADQWISLTLDQLRGESNPMNAAKETNDRSPSEPISCTEFVSRLIGDLSLPERAKTRLQDIVSDQQTGLDDPVLRGNACCAIFHVLDRADGQHTITDPNL
ncbi:hypothetical protein C447_00820 [Halococcus hamelinensis 100A6]|uniref:CoB--CoM heterodisulfide reductase iron-sulfur subunit A n=2 Tax=Halococcus hamelinensis TaxID=332168 RepID=M0M9S4_9EURY|nr:hypothetical protein C447_00820 [Halococcus hamelinensis 100A6]